MLNIYSIEQTEQWDAVVRSFRDYDVYWLSGYVRAFQINGDGIPLLVYFEGGSTRGINVVMKRDIADVEYFVEKIDKNKYYDLSTPYGYGGWIIEGEDRKTLFSEYDKWLKKNRIVSEFVRFHPLLHNQEYCSGYYDVIRLGEVVHMDLSSPERIWENITSKNRNMIRKAMKNDVKIYNGRYPLIYDRFREIYNLTMDKDGADKYYYFPSEFYTSVLNDLSHNAQVFWAEKEGQIIAASIILAANGRLNYHLSGSIIEYNNLAPTNLLLYEVALWGSKNGFRTLYLGGGVGSENDSLFRFKRAFYKGDIEHFYIGKRIVDQDSYEILSRIRGNIDSHFFPIYRAKITKS